jgi:hypothetical protein
MKHKNKINFLNFKMKLRERSVKIMFIYILPKLILPKHQSGGQ